MPDSRFARFLFYLSVLFLAFVLVALLPIPAMAANSAYVRVNQVGSETARAYLMSTAVETGATSTCACSSGIWAARRRARRARTTITMTWSSRCSKQEMMVRQELRIAVP